MFYIICNNIEQRTGLIVHLKQHGILSVFHYLSLHSSSFMKNKTGMPHLPNTDIFSDNLLRLPLYYELSSSAVENICKEVNNFLNSAT
ncbi:hypothetical protein BH11BAC6_BH11BAC6_00150 [soil metagenome]